MVCFIRDFEGTMHAEAKLCYAGLTDNLGSSVRRERAVLEPMMEFISRLLDAIWRSEVCLKLTDRGPL